MNVVSMSLPLVEATAVWKQNSGAVAAAVEERRRGASWLAVCGCSRDELRRACPVSAAEAAARAEAAAARARAEALEREIKSFVVSAVEVVDAAVFVEPIVLAVDAEAFIADVIADVEVDRSLARSPPAPSPPLPDPVGPDAEAFVATLVGVLEDERLVPQAPVGVDSEAGAAVPASTTATVDAWVNGVVAGVDEALAPVGPV